LELLRLFHNKIKLPIIINGGMGCPKDGIKALEMGADALAAAYIFHFSKYTPDMIKKELLEYGFSMRLH
jgi:cyclase